MTFQTFLSTLEFLGLVTAFLEFTGWSKRIQSRIDRFGYHFSHWIFNKGLERAARAVGLYIAIPTQILLVVVLYGLLVRGQYFSGTGSVLLFLTYVPVLV